MQNPNFLGFIIKSDYTAFWFEIVVLKLYLVDSKYSICWDYLILSYDDSLTKLSVGKLGFGEDFENPLIVLVIGASLWFIIC